MNIDETQKGSVSGGTSNGVSQTPFLPKGFITCPYCNYDDKVQLVDVYTAIDEKITIDSGLPNVYVVSVLKCRGCGLRFSLPRVDARFGKGE